jgi:hypothetical protein
MLHVNKPAPNQHMLGEGIAAAILKPASKPE